MAERRAVIDYDLWNRLNVRKWGLPSHQYAGRAWRNDDRANPTISIFVQNGDVVEVQTARVVWSDARRYLFPRGWRDAFANYLGQWPDAARWQRRALAGKRALVVRRG